MSLASIVFFFRWCYQWVFESCYSATCTADTAEIIVNSKTGKTNYTSYYTIYKEISSVFHNVLCKGVLDNNYSILKYQSCSD